MPPPIFRPGSPVVVVTPTEARICLRQGGYRRTMLPPGTYQIVEIHRNPKYWHMQDLSDGYTYRIDAEIAGAEQRVSVWQNDLLGGVHGQ